MGSGRRRERASLAVLHIRTHTHTPIHTLTHTQIGKRATKLDAAISHTRAPAMHLGLLAVTAAVRSTPVVRQLTDSVDYIRWCLLRCRK